MKRTLTLAVLVAFLVPALVMARPDPGAADKVYLGAAQPDGAGKYVVPINIFNDEPLTAIDIPLKFGNAGDGIVLDQVTFADGRAVGFDFKFAKPDNQAKTVLIGLVSSMASLKEDMPTGDGAVAFLHFTVTDNRINAISFDVDKTRAPQHTMLLIQNKVVDNGGKEGRDVVDFAPSFTAQAVKLTGSVDNLPKEYSLGGNYPNPFNAKTLISFALPQQSKVTLDIYNILGQKVRTLVDGTMPAGFQKVEWDGTDRNGLGVSSGVYLYKLTANDFVRVNRMTFLK